MKKHWTTEQLHSYLAEQYKNNNVTVVSADLGNGPAADYNKDSGSWTGD